MITEVTRAGLSEFESLPDLVARRRDNDSDSDSDSDSDNDSDNDSDIEENRAKVKERFSLIPVSVNCAEVETVNE